jgi:hypothetical protein
LKGSSVQAATNERAVVEFKETVKLLNVYLRGEYLIIHDDSKMAQGEPCFYVYSNTDRDKLIIAFHCKPVERDKADHFILVTSRRNLYDVPEVIEFQFAGANKAHQVPKV